MRPVHPTRTLHPFTQCNYIACVIRASANVVRFWCTVHVLVHLSAITMQSPNGNMNKGWTTQWQTTKLNAIEIVEKHNNNARLGIDELTTYKTYIATVSPGWRQTCHRQCMSNGFCMSQRQRPVFRTNADVSVSVQRNFWFTSEPVHFFYEFRVTRSFAKILSRTILPILYFG